MMKNPYDNDIIRKMLSFLLSSMMHFMLVMLFSFVFNTGNHWRVLQAHSIPLKITKLSDITRGPRIGPVGLIDDTLPMSKQNQAIMPPSKGELDVQLKTKVEKKPDQKLAEAEQILKEETKLQEKKQINDDLDTIAKNKSVNEKKHEKDSKSNKNALKNALSKNSATKKQQADKFLEEVLKTDSNNKNAKKGSNKTGEQSKAKEQAKESFLNSVLGDEEGKGSKESGGAQELGELSTSAIAALVEMIRPCWTITPLPGADKILISLDVRLNKQGYVETVQVLNPNWSNPLYKTVAHSATRALSDKRCQPFKLPVQEYDKWKRLTINFCPCDLF